MSDNILLYNTSLFNAVFPSAADFITEYHSCAIPATITDAEATTIYYLLYARYGNNPIANNDETQWKYKVFSVVYQYGPYWSRRKAIQDTLLALPDSEVMLGAKHIFNHANNPSVAPTTATLDELTFVNDQNVQSVKRNKVDGYMALWESLRADLTKNFLNQFKDLFKIVVTPENVIVYESDN